MKSGLIVGNGPRQVRDATIPRVRGERRRIAAGLALLGGLALLALPAQADVGSSPGKTTAARSASGLDLSGWPSVNAQLYKGKRGTMLVVHGVVAAHAQGAILVAGVKANGIAMEPTDFAGDSSIYSTDCQGVCSVSGTWWLDLDLAEQAHPGMFVNVPINVTLLGQTMVTGTQFYKMSVMATLTKK